MEWMSLGIIKENKIYISAASSKIPSYFKEGEIIPLEGTASEYVIKTASIPVSYTHLTLPTTERV